MASNRSAFRLMVPWDRAVQALDRAIRQKSDEYELLERDNGYLRLRHRDGVVLNIEIRIETPQSTVIVIRGKRKRFDLHRVIGARVNSVVDAFRDDIVNQLQGVRTAA